MTTATTAAGEEDLKQQKQEKQPQQQQQEEEGEVRGRVREGKGDNGDKQPSLLLLLQQYFPKPFIARPLQVECLRRIGEEALKQGYRDIIISAPTGIGKSMIALTLANASGKYELLRVGVEGKENVEEGEGEEEEGEEIEEGADILTATTFLQDQYAREFKEIRTIMGRGNFLCLKYDLPAREVPTSECRKVVVKEEEVKEEGGEAGEEREGKEERTIAGDKEREDKKRERKRERKEERKKVKVVYCIYHPKRSGSSSNNNICPYYKQKIEGLRSRIRVMNYHEYLTLLARGELSSSNREYSKRPRPLLIMDEAHAIEDMVVSFFTITIGRGKARRLGIVNIFDSIVSSCCSSSCNSSANNDNNCNSSSSSSNNSSSSSSNNSSSSKTLSSLALGLLSNYLQACEVEKDMLEKKKREIEEMIEEVERRGK